MDKNDTIFGKIIRGDIPCDKVYEDENVLAFHDINPAAPVHILVIPKRHIVNLCNVDSNDSELLGQMLLAASTVAAQEGLEDFRLVVNNGSKVGQTVFHLHLHILGGRPFSWPPG